MTGYNPPTDIRAAWLSKAEKAELAKLYARRSAIDALIDSLKVYDTCGDSQFYAKELKTA
jgi:hypothetical protein